MPTFLVSLLGGLLIGLASTLMLLWLGRIMGVSGIVYQCLGRLKRSCDWRYGFLLGLILGGVCLKSIWPKLFLFDITLTWVQVIVGGVLVGFGTVMGSGCTSGHGVCGIPRFSIRSIFAVILFMGIGIITATLIGILT